MLAPKRGPKIYPKPIPILKMAAIWLPAFSCSLARNLPSVASSIAGIEGIIVGAMKQPERKRPITIIVKLSLMPRIFDGPTKIKKNPRKKALVI